MTILVSTSAASSLPALVTAAGDYAAYRFLEFFTAQIRNPHTRRAYARAVGDFCVWLEDRHLPSITAVTSVHVAAYIEKLGKTQSAPTVKQQLAAIRMLFDWLTTGGILPFNPTSAVRGPKHTSNAARLRCSTPARCANSSTASTSARRPACATAP
jgi:site-specific recombinase XerD